MLSGAEVVIRRVVCGIVCVALAPCHVSAAQSTVNVTDAYVPTMTFDVASVRESKPDLEHGFRAVVGGFQPSDSSHVHMENWSLVNLLMYAYSSPKSPLYLKDIDAGDSARFIYMAFFNVDAKGDEETDARLAKMPKEQVRAEQRHMVQGLLADRFKLKMHWEDREKPTYDLIVAKAGRLVSTGAPPSEDELKRFGDRPVPRLYQSGSSMRGFEYIAHGATAGDIAEMLTGQFGQRVNDKTGLTGKYDFRLKTYQVRAEDRKMDETNPWPPLENALEDELGLKLVRSKGLVRTLVIDHVERPTEN